MSSKKLGRASHGAKRALGDGNRQTIKEINEYFLVVVPPVIVPFGSAAQKSKMMTRRPNRRRYN